MPVREYSGNAKSTTLVGTISATATSILLADAVGYPTGTTGPFVITVDAGAAAEEKVLCASRTGNTITVATGGRGWDGTTASDHDNGASIRHTYSATDAREANAHVNQTTDMPHGGAYLTPADAGAAYVAKAGGTMTGLLTADAGLLSQPQRVFDRFVGTAESSTSTTFVALPTLLERDFTVPPSERIVVLLRGDIVNSSTGLSLMSFDVFEPATSTVIAVPSDDRSIYVQGTDRVSLGAAVLVILAGHAGKSFRLRERVRVTGGTGTWQRRQITYVPSL
jgi:hypothetical protein